MSKRDENLIQKREVSQQVLASLLGGGGSFVNAPSTSPNQNNGRPSGGASSKKPNKPQANSNRGSNPKISEQLLKSLVGRGYLEKRDEFLGKLLCPETLEKRDENIGSV